MRFTRPPVIVSAPVSASVTRKSCSSWMPCCWIVALASQGDGEIVVHRLVVEEVLLDHVAAIAEAEHELAEAVVGVVLHDVPEDRPPAHLDHRLGPELGLLAQSRSQSSATELRLSSRWSALSCLPRCRGEKDEARSERRPTDSILPRGPSLANGGTRPPSGHSPENRLHFTAKWPPRRDPPGPFLRQS